MENRRGSQEWTLATLGTQDTDRTQQKNTTQKTKKI
jgi:hypothetical protein